MGSDCRNSRQALDEGVDRAAVVAGDAAEEEPEREADRQPEQADEQRGAGAEQHAAEQVAAERVGAREEDVAAGSSTPKRWTSVGMKPNSR